MGEAKARRNRIEETIHKTTEQLIEEGWLIMAGFAAYREMVIPKDASPTQIRECWYAYMAGAQHLFASILTVLDAGDEPTPNDERRMELVFREMDEFAARLAADHYPTTGRA